MSTNIFLSSIGLLITTVLFSLNPNISTVSPSTNTCEIAPPSDPLIVYFQKPSSWPSAKIYYWGETPASTMPDVAWPGVDMQLMQADCDWYYFVFSETVDCSNIIFHNGVGTQTADLNRCTDGYYQFGIGWSSSPPSGFCGNPPPIITVTPSGTYNNLDPFVVTIQIYDNIDPSPTIYYTLDGSTPTISSSSGLDGMTINITEDTTLKCIGVDADGAQSAVQTHNYTVGVQPPLTVYFLKPTNWSTVKIHYWDAEPSDIIADAAWPGVDMIQNQPGCAWYYYTFPSQVDCINVIFNNGGSGGSNQTADLYRCDDGYYIIGNGWTSSPPSGFCSPNAAPILSMTPPSGDCVLPTSVNIAASDVDGDPTTIHYTLDGTDPTVSSPIWVPGTTLPTMDFTIKAVAIDDEFASSGIETRIYTDNNAVPSHMIMPLGPKTFNPSINVVISAEDDCSTNATIYYTTDGSEPTTSSPSTSNSLFLYLTQTTTIKYFVGDGTGNYTSTQQHTYTYDPNFGCGVSEDDYFTWDNATVYFAVTDRFKDGNTANNVNYGRQSDLVGGFHGGDLQGMTQKIMEGYFDSLGVDAIWITPPVEQIHGHVPGWGMVPEFQRHYGYHGYYALDWTELDANMGTVDDFRTMIDTAHAHGIRVIMDVVMNHTGYDTPEDITEFGWSDCSNWWGSQWIRKDDIIGCSPCGGGDLQSCLAGLPDILSESTSDVNLPPILLTKWNASKEAQEIAELNTFFTNTGLPRTPINHIIKWLTDWVREYGIDGFRLDTYKHIEIQNWGQLKTQAEIALDEWKTSNPNKALDEKPFWMVGENYGSGITRWADAINIGKTDALINFNFQGQAGNLSTIDNIYSSYASVANPDPTWNFLSYISSHDTQLSNRDNLILEGSTFLLLPGAVQIYYGDETKRLPGAGPGDQPTRSDMNWNSIDQNVLSHWKKLGQFRQSHPSVGAGQHTKLQTTPYIFKRSLAREDAQDDVIVVLGASGDVTINVTSINTWTNGTTLRNAYNGQIATVIGGTVIFNSGPNGVILIENPNPVILPTIMATPENNTYDADGMTVCLSGFSMDCSPVTVYYTFDLNASESDLSNWTTFNGCFPINETTSLKAVAINNTNGLHSNVLTLNYYTAIPDMHLYYKNTNGYSSVFLYHWNTLPASTQNTSTAWPGKPMTLICDNNTTTPVDDWYELTLPATLTTNLIFNCGNNTCQTANLSSPGSLGFYDTGSWNTSIPSSYCSDCSVVTTTSNDGNGSLRYAIGCAIPGSTLSFAPALDQQIILVSQTIPIEKNLSIICTDDIMVNGSGMIEPVFQISTNKSVLIEGLNIQCATTGEGRCIENNGKLTLDNVTMMDPQPSDVNSAVLNNSTGQLIIKNTVQIEK
ncbi:MAG: starch-binding protein [Saprospiraceae bacterium]